MPQDRSLSMAIVALSPGATDHAAESSTTCWAMFGWSIVSKKNQAICYEYPSCPPACRAEFAVGSLRHIPGFPEHIPSGPHNVSIHRPSRSCLKGWSLTRCRLPATREVALSPDQEGHKTLITLWAKDRCKLKTLIRTSACSKADGYLCWGGVQDLTREPTTGYL